MQADSANVLKAAQTPEELRARPTVLTYADVCGRMQTYADVCGSVLKAAQNPMLSFCAGGYYVCGRMLTYADVCCLSARAAITYADVC